jgi:LuxR family transcriptional regulator of spore coat protein
MLTDDRGALMDDQRDGLDYVLTGREQEVLEQVASGWSAKEIGRLIGAAPRTVERHIDNIRAKMSVRNTPHMVCRAFSDGLLQILPTPLSKATPRAV